MATTNLPTASLSAEEVQRAKDYLSSTYADFLHALRGLSDAQRQFKPAPDRWSIAEILEHLVIVEGRVHDRIRSLSEGALSEEGRNDERIDAFVIEKVARRAEKVQAPPPIQPTGQITFEEALARFTEARNETSKLPDAEPTLRGRTAPHPVLGFLDGYQWLLAVAAHTNRHLDQIKEVKADPGFSKELMSRSDTTHINS